MAATSSLSSSAAAGDDPPRPLELEKEEEEEENASSAMRQKLMSAEEVYVYKIPPLKTAGGHRYVHAVHRIQDRG